MAYGFALVGRSTAKNYMNDSTILLFLATIFQVVLIAMQTMKIVENRPWHAAACAFGIAVTNIVAYKLVPTASVGDMMAYVTANGVGVPIAMALGSHGRHRITSIPQVHVDSDNSSRYH